MLTSLRLWPLLAGNCGRAAADVDRLVEVLVRFSYLVTDFPEIAENCRLLLTFAAIGQTGRGVLQIVYDLLRRVFRVGHRMTVRNVIGLLISTLPPETMVQLGRLFQMGDRRRLATARTLESLH